MHIYDINLKYITDIPYPLELLLETYPQYQKDHYFSEIFIRYPKLVDGELLSKTDTELKLEGVLPLSMGEKIIKGKLVEVPKPNGYKIEWDNDSKVWIEAITKQELVQVRLDKMVEYAKIEENKNKISTLKFTSDNEIEVLNSELTKLEQEINKISSDIDSML